MSRKKQQIRIVVHKAADDMTQDMKKELRDFWIEQIVKKIQTAGNQEAVDAWIRMIMK